MASKPGLVRWAPVEGATAYDVWYPDIRKVIRTHTNVADQRELYSFHLEDSWWQLARWRVRAGAAGRRRPPQRPACSLLRAMEPDLRDDEPGLVEREAAAARSSVGRGEHGQKAAAHQLMPAMTFGGDTGTDGRQYRLFRATPSPIATA